ncbi:hypothetical protein GCM10009718_27850 [Isoptericola halotolerans]|uniref:Uncharacterized protein n=1 Tax=Isoptericola halotolerans TaxID=300560 RepID=A0ABX2A3Q8_9MICO|nr:hypothetical protein [Isoptericola halotolerans]NOV97365.1 hypothetical protein [Isoptericola halotolerans]
MLKQVVRLVLTGLVLSVALVAPSVGAVADTQCGPGEVPVPVTDSQGSVRIVCERADGGGPGTGTGGGGGGAPQCFLASAIPGYDGLEIPCVDDFFGVWNAGLQCYMSEFTGNIPKDSPIWEGNDDGYIVTCTLPDCVIFDRPFPGTCSGPAWSPDPPTVGPSPQELAERAVAAMTMKMGEVGSTPPSTEMKADSVGIVGVPIWLWVADPGQSTVGPITETASDGGLTVTAVGELDRIVWELADSSGEVYRTVECVGADAPGTPWSEEISDGGRASSPTCGFDASDNVRTGRLTLTGTAYWTVAWSGGGQEGTIDIDGLPRSASLEIGEVQVITQ